MASGTIPINGMVNLYQRVDNIQMSASMAYTGVHFTIPANSYYSVSVRAVYTNSEPRLIALNTSSTGPYSSVATGEYIHVNASLTYSSMTGSTAQELFVWAQYASAALNSIEVTGFYVKK